MALNRYKLEVETPDPARSQGYVSAEEVDAVLAQAIVAAFKLNWPDKNVEALHYSSLGSDLGSKAAERVPVNEGRAVKGE